MSAKPPSTQSKLRRSTVVLNATGVLLALWLGLTAPSASPVAVPPPGAMAPLVPGAGR